MEQPDPESVALRFNDRINDRDLEGLVQLMTDGHTTQVKIKIKELPLLGSPWMFFLVLILIPSGLVSSGKTSLARETEMEIVSSETVKISGTLTLPTGIGPHPAVVLLHGSSRRTRQAHSFDQLAQALALKGIASFRYDSPGTGKSSGKQMERTLTERAQDALNAIKALKKRDDIKQNGVGLYGVSEGGWVVYRAASLSKQVDFIVSISGPAVSKSLQGRYFTKMLCQKRGFSEEDTKKFLMVTVLNQEMNRDLNTLDYETLTEELKSWKDDAWIDLLELVKARKERNDREFGNVIYEIVSNWVQSGWLKGKWDNKIPVKEFVTGILEDRERGIWKDLDTDPVEHIEKIQCPMLCIFGDADQMVNGPESAEIIKKVLQKTSHKESMVHVYPKADHALKIVKDGRRVYPHDHLSKIIHWILENTDTKPFSTDEAQIKKGSKNNCE